MDVVRKMIKKTEHFFDLDVDDFAVFLSIRLDKNSEGRVYFLRISLLCFHYTYMNYYEDRKDVKPT
jgi:hypothetical protein